MSLVFAALVPHPPILIPTIGKKDVKKVEKTAAALAALEEELYLSKPNVIIVISPHGHLLEDAFSLNYCTEFNTDLREFGDLTTKKTYKGESNLAYAIREASKTSPVKAMLTSEQKLDHGTSVPLFFLTRHLSNVSILPIGFSFESLKSHFEFGSLIKEEIMRTNKRVAIIASGDLSHALTTNAPAGFSKTGAEFDAKMQSLLSAHNSAGIVALEPQFVESAKECGLRSIAILMGALRNVSYTTKLLAYEAPFGVGYLTAEFALS